MDISYIYVQLACTVLIIEKNLRKKDLVVQCWTLCGSSFVEDFFLASEVKHFHLLSRVFYLMMIEYRYLNSLPCLLCVMCVKDTCTMEEKMLKDPRRLYAPGRLYHIVERKPFRYERLC